MKPTLPTVATLLAAALVCLRGQARPLQEPLRPIDYWAHGTLTGLAFAGGWAVRAAGNASGGSFGLDDGEPAHISESASALSDRLLWLTLALPLGAQLSRGVDTALGNATLIYTQTHSLTLLSGAVAKSLLRRKRPYTHAEAPRVREYAAHAGAEAHFSFFSGHSSSAFTSATAGSILVAARMDDAWARHIMWGLEFGLAGTVARLRIIAGRHYRTDVWTGTLVGVGFGILVPWLHRIELGRVRASEWGVGAGAATTTLLLSELLGPCGPFPCSMLPRNVILPISPPTPQSVSFTLLPAAFQGGAGVQAVGEF